MKADAVLIHRPERQPRAQRAFFGVLTAIAWSVYAYLWLPLITLVVWALGLRASYVEIYLRSRQVDAFLPLVLPIIALVVAVLLIGWAEYNRRRFGHLNRRRAQPAVSVAAVATTLGASEDTTQALQRARSTVLRMSDGARPVGHRTGH